MNSTMDEPDYREPLTSRQVTRSALRTIFYGALIGALLLWDRHGSPTVSALVTGLLLADYLTWLIRTIPTAFSDLLHGAWQTAVNVTAAMLIFKVCDITVPRDAEELGVGFLAFLLVIAIKTTYYTASWLTEEGADD